MAGGVVEVDSSKYEVGNGDKIGSFGEERQKRDEIVSVVVGLMVEDHAWLVSCMVDGRHILIDIWWGMAIPELEADT